MKNVILFVLAFAASLGALAQSREKVLKQIEITYRPDFISGNNQSWLNDVQRYSSELTSEGTWNDVDYTAVDSLDFFPKTIFDGQLLATHQV